MQLPGPELMNFFERAATQYQAALAADTSAQAYLAGRGITREVASMFRLGVVRQPLLGHERFRDRLAIPYITPAGVMNFSFRCIAGHVCKDTVLRLDRDGKEVTCRKYLALDGYERTLYNVLDLRKDSARIHIVEGEIDAITWSISGYPTVGSPGVKLFKPWYRKIFADYTEVIALADGDEAGYKFGTFLAREVQAQVVRLPRGEDGNSLYAKGGRDALARVFTDTPG